MGKRKKRERRRRRRRKKKVEEEKVSLNKLGKVSNFFMLSSSLKLISAFNNSLYCVLNRKKDWRSVWKRNSTSSKKEQHKR